MRGNGSADWIRIRHALKSIAHRGPDGEGLLGITPGGAIADTDAPCRILLGFRRLAILDLTHGADQPMRCPLTGNILTFNGEIYNFLELRAELESLGHRFRTASDSEVILAAYAQWGRAAFGRFNGMWGIALYDAKSGALLLSRDRMGVKPLYIARDDQAIHFASEIRAVIRLLGTMPRVNEGELFDFLAGIEIDHHDETLFENIVNLPAGALWTITRDGTLMEERYHNWPEGTKNHTAAEMHDLFTDAVKLRLRSDAPTVSLLSSGLDSSITTWVAAQNAHAPRSKFVGAFSYGYNDARYAEHDEVSRAEAFIAGLPEKITHHVRRMDPVPSIDELLALTATQELPSTTPSIIASWRLYQQIRAAGIKVVLSSEGADELFAGYTRRYLPQLARDALLTGNFGHLLQLIRSPHLPLSALLNRLAWQLPSPALITMLRSMRPNVATINRDFWQRHQGRMSRIIADYRTPLPTRLRRDIIRDAMPQILRYADRNSMHASVEARLPFMDYRMVELALTTAPEAKLSSHGGKQILRDAFAGILPDAITRQPKTLGFGNAEQYQVLNLSLAPLIERAPASAWDYLDRSKLTRLLARPQAHPMIWLPVSFLLWMTVRHEQRF